ncbi:MAG: hypothetical protein IE922_17375, partial [Sphingomonadales bacterium]|nr:hypothetical protein [Sphingomonadales bacterium]
MFRRDFLSFGIAGGLLAGGALPHSARAQGGRGSEALITAADLGGDVSFVVADLRSGLVLEERGAAKPMAPASTAK